MAEITKKCAQCAEQIKLEALVCRYCAHRFDPDQVKRDVEAVQSSLDRGREVPAGEARLAVDIEIAASRLGITNRDSVSWRRVRVTVVGTRRYTADLTGLGSGMTARLMAHDFVDATGKPWQATEIPRGLAAIGGRIEVEAETPEGRKSWATETWGVGADDSREKSQTQTRPVAEPVGGDQSLVTGTSTWSVLLDPGARPASLRDLVQEVNPQLQPEAIDALLQEPAPQIASGLSLEQANALMTRLLAIGCGARKEAQSQFDSRESGGESGDSPARSSENSIGAGLTTAAGLTGRLTRRQTAVALVVLLVLFAGAGGWLYVGVTDDVAVAVGNRGVDYLRKGDYDRAIRDYGWAIWLKPNFAWAFFNRGFAYYSKGEYDRAIRDYDQGIRLQPDNAVAFSVRGYAYHSKGEYDQAIRDYDWAIRLRPDDAVAFNNRGFAYSSKGEYDRAIRDYDQAIGLKPDWALAFRGRGLVRFNQGNFNGSVPDFAKALQLSESDSYNVIWLYLAKSRAGESGRQELGSNAMRLDMKKWPGPVVELYLERLSPEAVLATISDRDGKIQREQQCEAYFFVAEYRLISRRSDEARSLLEKTVAICPPNFVEHRAAQTELNLRR